MHIIIKPAEYYEAFGSQATGIQLCDVEVLDWKSERTKCFKDLQNSHFQISKCSRIIMERSIKPGVKITVRGELFYRADTGKRLPVFKRGMTSADIQPTVLPMGVRVK